MRLSGVLPEDDDGSTDLATLEKRLADRAGQSGTPITHTPDERRESLAQPMDVAEETQTQPGLPSPRSGTASPEPPRQTTGNGREEDALAEMMCSLVTNNCGETRYIGERILKQHMSKLLILNRVIFRVLHFLSKRHSVGE